MIEYQISITEDETQSNVIKSLLSMTGDELAVIVQNSLSFYLWAIRECKNQRRIIVSAPNLMANTPEKLRELGLFKPVIKGINDD